MSLTTVSGRIHCGLADSLYARGFEGQDGNASNDSLRGGPVNSINFSLSSFRLVVCSFVKKERRGSYND